MLTLDPTKDPRWKKFIAKQPDAQMFHHPAWLGLLNDEYQFRTFAFCLERAGEIVAGLPLCEIKSMRGRLRWVCLPFSDKCGPIGESSVDVEQLLAQALHASRQAGATLEIRDEVDSISGMDSATTHWLHIKDINAPQEALLRSLHPDIRRRIKKCESEGLVTHIRHDHDAMRTFYALHVATRRRQGVPVQPRSYFDKLQSRIIDEGMGFIAVTGKIEVPLSAAVFCTMNKTLLYKYGASDPEKMNLSPNYQMFWKSIVHAKSLGLCSLDMGKTSKDNEGLRLFKQKWGATETELAYSYSPVAPSESTQTGLIMNIAHKVIQNSPEFVCRLAGELLYRRFAA
jgi:CelD/BcsL family acetyltransferase involved in cellulose biosynthesis